MRHGLGNRPAASKDRASRAGLLHMAAHADQQVRIAKSADEDATTTTVESVGGEARVVELSRMLSGTPDSAAARSNAKDLLERVPRRAPDPSTAGPTR